MVFKNRLAWTVWVAALWGWVAAGLILLGFELYPWGNGQAELRFWQMMLLEPIGNMWFIYSIAILGVLCMAMRTANKFVFLLVAILLSVSALLIVQFSNMFSGFNQVVLNLGLRGFLFFTIGFIFAERLITPTPKRLTLFLVEIVTWVGCYYIVSGVDAGKDFYRLALAVPATISALYILQYLLAKLPAISSVF